MSFYSDASLVLIPSGYKDQKVYSAVPTDGSGDLVFSRASSATRVASNGLIEKVRTNVALYSEQFDNAAWVKTDCTVTPNTTANPINGALTADTIVFNGADDQIAQVFNVSNHTLSVYVKGTAGETITVGFGAGAEILHTLTGGFDRVSVTGSSTFFVYIGTFLGATARTIIVYGAQLETGDIATDYIATTTAAVSVGPVSGLPRLDYLGSTCGKLLLEPQRTNLLQFSEQFNNAVWSATRASFTANQTTAPDGYTGADLYTDGTFTGNVSFVEQSVVVGGSGTTYSVFVKKGTANFVQFGFYDTDFHGFVVNTSTWASTNTFGSASSFTATNYGNGWYRLSMYKAASTNTIFVSVAVAANSTGANYNGTGALTAYFWGAQVEAANSSYATSYIPTLGTSVTRVADAALTGSVPSLIGQTEGVMFIDFNRLGTLDDSFFILSNVAGTTSSSYQNSVYIYQIANGNLVVESYISNVQQFSFSSTALSVGRHKVAIAYKQNDFALYVDGVLRATDTSGNVPAMNYLTIAGGADVSAHVQAVNQALLFKTRLSNSDLATLTTL